MCRVGHYAKPSLFMYMYIYLAALAVVDLVFLTLMLISLHSLCGSGWFGICCMYLHASVTIVDPLLILGFSVERLIAILRPFQV